MILKAVVELLKNSKAQVTGGSLSRTHSRKDGAAAWGPWEDVFRCEH